MKLSYTNARKNIWVWIVWVGGIYLILELGIFVMAGWIFKATTRDLVAPYLAFAFPSIVVSPLIWWLRKWEDGGDSAKKLAQGWGLSWALFGIIAIMAILYTEMKLHLCDTNIAVTGAIVSAIMVVPISYFGVYHMVLPIIISRSSRR